MTRSPSTQLVFAVSLFVMSTAMGCKSNEPLAKERIALENEWLPFWKGKNCTEFYREFKEWKQENAARIEKIETKWKALSQNTRNDLTKRLSDESRAAFRAKIEIALKCGLAPRLSEP